MDTQDILLDGQDEWGDIEKLLGTKFDDLEDISLPATWSKRFCLAMLCVISCARTAFMKALGNLPPGGEAEMLQLRAENGELKRQLAIRKKLLKIVNSRLMRVNPRKRPRFTAYERFELLEIKALLGLNKTQAAKLFVVTGETIRKWSKAVKDGLPLIGLAEHPSKYPDYIRQAVQRVTTWYPHFGKKRIAGLLARMGLHLAVSTIGRIRGEPPIHPATVDGQPSPPDDEPAKPGEETKEIAAYYPNHVWNIDLTLVPTMFGLQSGLVDDVKKQQYPYCYHVLNVLDQFSRRLMGSVMFLKEPTSMEITDALGGIIHREGASPKHIICDRGSQFTSGDFKKWCKDAEIKPRYGALGSKASIAVTERLHLTMKNEFTRKLDVTLVETNFQRDLDDFRTWYNRFRPHSYLGGATPDEKYSGQTPANTLPRFEPRALAKPRVELRGKPGQRVQFDIDFVGGNKLLPIFRAK